MNKCVMSVVLLFSLSSLAKDCGIKDVRDYFLNSNSNGLESPCRDQGSSVASISSTGAGGIPRSHPASVFFVRCENGSAFVGTLYLDAVTCKGKSALIEPTVQIYQK